MKTKTILCVALAAGLLAGCVSEKSEQNKQARLATHAKIAKAEAQRTALAKVPNGTVTEAEIEKEHGRLIWSFDMATPDSKNTTEVNVDAITGAIAGHPGAWLPGKDTEIPGVLIPAHPRVGDKFKSEDVPHITWEQDEVVSVSETVTVPAGTFRNCVKIKETTSDGDTECKLYAPGVGCIAEIESGGELRLTSHETK